MYYGTRMSLVAKLFGREKLEDDPVISRRDFLTKYLPREAKEDLETGVKVMAIGYVTKQAVQHTVENLIVPREAYAEATIPTDETQYDKINKQIADLLDNKDYQTIVNQYSVFDIPDNKNAKYFNRMGFAHVNLGNFDKAIDFYKKSAKIIPHEPNIWKNIGVAYKRKGDIPNAVEAFQEYANRLPDGKKKNRVLKWIDKNK